MLRISYILFSIIWLSDTYEECKRNFSIKQNAIILTKSSQAKGAKFIHKQVVSRFPECYALCCSNPDCTVAVYENKVNHFCFLFNCLQPNICSFTDHSHYIVMMYTKPERKPVKYEKPKPVLNKPTADGKLRELCGDLRRCGQEYSVCASGTCICQQGYIERNRKCVQSVCPKPELMFQCFDITKIPYCVALYDQCNGLYECGDGSDENNCEDKSYGRLVTGNTTVNLKNSVPIEGKVTNQISDIIPDQPFKISKEQESRIDDRFVMKTNISRSSPPRSHKLQESHIRNPVADELLSLESRNGLPKYSHLFQQTKSLHRPYSKSERESGSNLISQNYDSGPYMKHKTSSYTPRMMNLDEYYQKSVPESTDNGNRWSNNNNNNNIDPYYSNYEYPQLTNRDQISDWDGDKGSNVNGDSNYRDNPGKYFNEQNRYSYYPDSDDEVYSKPRGRYISDSDDYNSKPYENKAYEQQMDHSRRKNEEKSHAIFSKPKLETNVIEKSGTSSTSKENIIINDNMDGRNTQEWSNAVIMLSLGLLITATMLIAIGIKMRSWRKKLRKGKKGKSLTTDEGDFLINGMYL